LASKSREQTSTDGWKSVCHRTTEPKETALLKHLRVSSAPQSRRRPPRSFRPCRLAPPPDVADGRPSRQWVRLGSVSRARRHRLSSLWARPLPRRILWTLSQAILGLRGPGPGPGNGCGYGWYRVPAGPVIRWGEARTRTDITAPIDSDRAVETLGPAPFPAEALPEAPAFRSLRHVPFQAAIRRFRAFSASASASRLVAKDISDRSWAWPERKRVQR
jgi:hypothetical protein